MKIRMIGDNVLLEIEDQDTVTSSGLIQAHSKGERTEAWALRAKVVGVGPKVGTIFGESETPNAIQVDPEIKTGDTVYVGKWEVQNAMIDGKKYATAKVKDILLVVE